MGSLLSREALAHTALAPAGRCDAADAKAAALRAAFGEPSPMALPRSSARGACVAAAPRAQCVRAVVAGSWPPLKAASPQPGVALIWRAVVVVVGGLGLGLGVGLGDGVDVVFVVVVVVFLVPVLVLVLIGVRILPVKRGFLRNRGIRA